MSARLNKSKEKKAKESDKEEKNILIVGDWIVDEFWVTGIHRSPTASRTGQSHCRVLQSPTSTIQSLGGAGRTASVLFNSSSQFKLTSVGIWDKKDTDILTGMLNTDINRGQNHHRIKRESIEKKEEKINLINLAELSEFNDKEKEYGTNRAMRIYQHTGTKIDLIKRIDWEVQSTNEKGWVSEKNILDNLADKIPKKVDAIVIKDMCKGIVSEAIIQFLCEKYKKNGKWYISSKAWKPTWFDKLLDTDIKLILIPQVSTQMAIREKDLSCWITSSGRPSKDALEKMDELYKRFQSKPTIVALPEDSSILACYADGNNIRGLLQLEKEPYPSAIETPMASVFFAALTTIMLDTKEDSIESVLKKAFAFTQTWIYKEADRVVKYDNWDPKNEESLDIDTLEDLNSYHQKTKYAIKSRWETPIFWEKEKEYWDMAFNSKNCGVITVEEDGKKYKKFELWRAMSDVKGYICCIKSKQKVLQNISKELELFKANETQYHKSCMLIASPGSGKTFLVKCLAKSLGLRELSFNITQMLSKKDILECFDTIVTTQAKTKGEAIVVFIDEINALLENQHVYDTFLSPLEEGIYVRAEKTFTVNPCFWIFAGTESPATNDINRDRSTKASDFVSRLSGGIFNLQIKTDNSDEAEEARVEKVYLGVSLLKSIFPDVREVSENVLKAFHILNPRLEVRDIKHFVKTFKDIQYGKVLVKNVADDWLKKHAFTHMDVTMWEKAPEGDMVEIVT